eukprot:gene25563-11213_t
MVQLHMKRSDAEQFIFETTIASTVQETINEMVGIFNMRQTIMRLKIEAEELAKYGPAKHPEKQGIDQYQEDATEKGPHYIEDPTGRRTGNACSPDECKVLMKTLEDAVALVDKSQVERKVCLSKKALADALDGIRGGVMICYPMGLPEWDFVRESLEETDDPTPCKMQAEKKLSDYLGRHEKTKAVVKLQKKGSGAPAREPAVDQDTQKAMMAWYYKKQEEQKKLAENEDDSYADSSWANPKSLKSHFAGVQSK